MLGAYCCCEFSHHLSFDYFGCAILIPASAAFVLMFVFILCDVCTAFQGCADEHRSTAQQQCSQTASRRALKRLVGSTVGHYSFQSFQGDLLLYCFIWVVVVFYTLP